MFRECLLLSCFIAVSQQIKISNFEVPQAVLAGTDAELKCDLEGRESRGFVLKWWFIPFGKDVQYPIYQRIHGLKPAVSPKFTDTFSIKEGSTDTLELKNAQPEYSGRYQCRVSDFEEGESRKFSDLYVYSAGSGPILNITTVEDSPDDNDTQDELIANCQAFNVTPRPILTIYSDASELIDVYENRTTRSDGLFDVSKSVLLDEDAVQGTVFCRITYQAFDLADVSDLSDTELFLVNETYYAPGNIAATPEDELATTDLNTTESVPDSCSAVSSSWVLWLCAATIVQLIGKYIM